MGSPLVDVAHGYASLALSLRERWRAHASSVASRLDAGAYGADGAAADLATSAALATESGLLLALQAVEGVAILSGRQHDPHVVWSEPFATSLGGATLTVAGPLTNGHASDTLPAGVISVEPCELGPTETGFRLRADATGHRGATYSGTVLASASGAVETLTVWITVP